MEEALNDCGTGAPGFEEGGVRLIIAGSRPSARTAVFGLSELDSMVSQSGFEPSVVICGCATGADMLGFQWARENGIKVEFFPAWGGQLKWALASHLPGEKIHPLPKAKHWRGAGFLRNADMAAHSDALLVVWDGESHGTVNMIEIAKAAGLPHAFVDLSKDLILRGNYATARHPHSCGYCDRHNVPGAGQCIDGTPHSFEYEGCT